MAKTTKEVYREMLNIIERDFSISPDGKSEKISLASLQAQYPDYEFLTHNGGHWRRNTSPIGQKYEILTFKETGFGNQVRFIQLNGFKIVEENHSIPQSVKQYFNSLPDPRCILTTIGGHFGAVGTGCQLEIDHKDGRYSKTDYSVEDFQILSKQANDIKRQRCKECRASGCRFDARTMGFSKGWLTGDASSNTCEGCFWYDIAKFRGDCY